MDRCESIPGRFDENILFSTIQEKTSWHQSLRQWQRGREEPGRNTLGLAQLGT